MYHLVKLLCGEIAVWFISKPYKKAWGHTISTSKKTPVFKSKRPCTKAVGEAEISIRNGVGKGKGERERKRLYKQKQKELKSQSQSTPDYVENYRVKKNALMP